jgi:polyhydroxyalkanoate synthesis regulator phasin
MSDEELVKRLRDPAFGTETSERLLMVAAADRIEALTAENERLEQVVKDISDEADLAEQEACMVEDDFVKAEKEIEALTAKLAKAMEGLRDLIQHAHNCEKELTEELHHQDFCGESLPLTNARATLAEIENSEAVTLGEKT